MKANKLMIGDWVYDTILRGYTKVELLSVSGIRGDFHESVYNENTFEPIPLTTEILEKNGMHLYNRKTNSLMEECNHSDCFKEDDNYRVELSLDYDGSIRWTINGDEYTIMPLDYVHQLQHALRLCGIEKTIEL